MEHEIERVQASRTDDGLTVLQFWRADGKTVAVKLPGRIALELAEVLMAATPTPDPDQPSKTFLQVGLDEPNRCLLLKVGSAGPSAHLVVPVPPPQVQETIDSLRSGLARLRKLKKKDN